MQVWIVYSIAQSRVISVHQTHAGGLAALENQANTEETKDTSVAPILLKMDVKNP